jgi:hypothetical protein
VSVAVLLGAAAHLVVIAFVGWVAGGALLDALARAPRAGKASWDPAAAEWPERALFAVVGYVAVAVVLMVGQLVTGGAVFGIPGVVPSLCAALVWWGWRRGRLVARLPWLAVAAAVIALGLVFATPAIVGGSGLRTGDVPWHMGWTEQLLAGEPVPTGPAPRFGANAYPWGFHAVLATMVRSVPGSSTQTALEALAFLLVVAIPLAAACLARRLRADAGWWAAAAAAGIGGVGWLGAHDLEFVTSPSRARFGADLVVASPNAIYGLFPPALPRELGLALLVGAALALLATQGSTAPRAGLVPGALTGLVGLVSVPIFVSGSLWALVAGGLHAPRARGRYGIVLTAAGLVTLGLWAGPVASALVRYGGFVDITPELGREWPLPTALGAWGLLLPLAALGLAVALRRTGRAARTLLAWVLVTAVLLALARIRSVLGWDLAGNATLLHQGRVWPVAHLLGAALAGVGLARIASVRLARGDAGALASVALVATGAVSPVLASGSLLNTIRDHRGGFAYGRPEVASESFLVRAAARMDPTDVVEVRGPPALAMRIWQYSGARLAAYDDPRLEGNELRIRYRDLAAAWDRRMDRGGFRADLIVLSAERIAPGARVLARGPYGGRDWALVRL